MKKHDRARSADPEHDAPPDEHAYEDSWYRSLKALAESRAARSPEENAEHEQLEGEPAGDEPTDADSSSR